MDNSQVGYLPIYAEGIKRLLPEALLEKLSLLSHITRVRRMIDGEYAYETTLVYGYRDGRNFSEAYIVRMVYYGQEILNKVFQEYEQAQKFELIAAIKKEIQEVEAYLLTDEGKESIMSIVQHLTEHNDILY